MNLKYSKNIGMRKIQINQGQEDLINVSKYVCVSVWGGHIHSISSQDMAMKIAWQETIISAVAYCTWKWETYNM